MIENLIKNAEDITEVVNILINKLLECEVITDKKITPKVKKANAYFYTGGGYDTETTTIKHTEILIKNKAYKCDTEKKVYYTFIGNTLNEERYNEFDESNVYIRPDFAFVYHVQIMIAGTYVVIRDFDLVSFFFKTLSTAIKKQFSKYTESVTSYPKIIIWVANLQYEWSFLRGIIKPSSVTSCFAKEKQPLYITLDDVIEFRECIGLFGKSLKSIAKNYTKTQKLVGDLDYDKVRTPETPLTDKEKEYCYNDVKILDELSYVAHNTYTKKHLRIPLTQTGIVRQEMKNALGNKVYYAYRENYLLMPRPSITEEDDPDLYKKECKECEKLYFEWRRYLYQGGYSHSNSKYVGELLENVRCVDIVSDYPFQMNLHYYPAGELIHVTNEKDYKKILDSNKCYILKVRLNDVHAKTSHTLISKNKVLNEESTKTCVWDNGRLYKGDNIVLWLNEVDLKHVCAMYNAKVTVLDMYYFTKRKSAPKFLRDVMNSHYIEKNSLKDRGLKNTPEYRIEKEKVNSIYGMTGTRIYKTICKILDNDFIEEKNPEFSYIKSIKKLWLNPYIAYWTTSYARNILVHYIVSYPDLIVQYDTDSLYFRTDKDVDQTELKSLMDDISSHNAKIENYNRITFDDKNMWDLGTWELEKPYTRFKCLGAKRYIYEKNGEIFPIIVGCPKDAFTEYVKLKKLNPFEFFDNHMLLSYAYSKKKQVFYRKDKTPVTEQVTDYLGNTSTITYKTFASIYEVPYTLKLKTTWLSELNEIASYDSKFPKEYQKYPELVDIIYGK